MLDGKPAIEVEINIDQNVGAVSGEFDVSKPENKNKLDELSGKKIKGICEDSVNKAKNELKTDIFGFGEAIHRKYPKVWEKLKDNWENEFPELPVKITVKAETKQLGQITKRSFTTHFIICDIMFPPWYKKNEKKAHIFAFILS